MILSLRKVITTARRFAGRLGRDVAGNTLAMMAIAVIPISAMIGSGVDMSRAYLTKSRLQQACDAGALAGRRAMTGATLDSAAKTQADNLFNFNFPAGTMNTTNVVFTPTNTVDPTTGNPAGQVTATATATMPTTIMRMFGKQEIVLDVACDAKLEVTNTDIMFVLDVTGSMNCAVGVSGDCGLVEQSSSKLSALRTAVVNFYTTINSAMTTDARLRIGFVPYSTTVNVGYLLPSIYFVDADHALYQSRERVLAGTSTTNSNGSWPANNSSTPTWSGYSGWSTVSNTTVSGSSACTTPAMTYSAGTATTGSPNSSTNSSTGVVTTTTDTTRLMTETSYQKTYTSSSKNCKIESRTRTRTETKTDTSTMTPDYNWEYKQWHPTAGTFADFIAGNAVTTMTGNTTSTNGPATSISSTWNGCIEERKTVSQTTFTTIPSTAYDMDIDMVPTSDQDTKWRPGWGQIIYDRPTAGTTRPDVGAQTTDNNSGGGYSKPSGNSLACPKAAQKLQTMTLDQVKQYVNAAPYNTSVTLKGVGYTYHDVGMIWGARLLSPTGIFASENATAPNGKPINRHIIFMTDGDMQPNADSYGLYGYEALDGRVGNGTTSDLTSRHNNRFVALCDAARAKNINIWVVAYASSLNTQLTSCADPGKSFTAANDTQLQQQFQTIAQRIARLRLSK